jgi:activating signal cointegrator 1
MRALTLLQPWAQLVAVKAKRYETRSWNTHYRGPLAIHASLEFPQSSQALCRCEPFAGALLGNEDLPLGCVVAICDLAAVIPTSPPSDSLFPEAEDFPESELPFGDFSPGRFAWLLQNVRALENPIPARGARSLWEWDDTALGLLDLTLKTDETPKLSPSPIPPRRRAYPAHRFTARRPHQTEGRSWPHHPRPR